MSEPETTPSSTITDKNPAGNSGAQSNAPESTSTVSQSKSDRPLRPISELISNPDFPKSALGEHVDIGGFTGVIVEIVKHSIRVRPQQGITMSYNINTLRKLYGPRVEAEVSPMEHTPSEAAAPAPAKPAEPTIEPDFTLPIQPIEQLVNEPDYPQFLLGKHLDLRGYEGVVVQIVNGSLKVRSREGATRSYNAASLRKLYAKK
ncbi:MAG TPA: hypothetical protein VEC99_03490 [Clostridia bacterium]|nr:hypothetical protein [Clostridia bacterium]